MKKFFVIAAMAAMTLVACNKDPKPEEPSVVKETIDDITVVDGALSFSINGVEGEYYAGAMEKSGFVSLASMNGEGDEGYCMAILQLCGDSWMQSPEATKVTAPATATFKTSYSFPMFMIASAAFESGKSYVIFIIPVDTADNNDKDTFDKIKWVEYTVK